MKLNAKEIIRILLSRENVKQKDLAEILTLKAGKKYTPGSLSQKINRGTISFNEVALIADILGYQINFDKQ
ncbi:hypothetical protein J6N69_06245 [bacterium]|nr:hypothetical protein [bacterium]MBP3846471.1 hypothetical protein [bacterium]